MYIIQCIFLFTCIYSRIFDILLIKIVFFLLFQLLVNYTLSIILKFPKLSSSRALPIRHYDLLLDVELSVFSLLTIMKY